MALLHVPSSDTAVASLVSLESGALRVVRPAPAAQPRQRARASFDPAAPLITQPEQLPFALPRRRQPPPPPPPLPSPPRANVVVVLDWEGSDDASSAAWAPLTEPDGEDGDGAVGGHWCRNAVSPAAAASDGGNDDRDSTAARLTYSPHATAALLGCDASPVAGDAWTNSDVLSSPPQMGREATSHHNDGLNSSGRGTPRSGIDLESPITDAERVVGARAGPRLVAPPRFSAGDYWDSLIGDDHFDGVEEVALIDDEDDGDAADVSAIPPTERSRVGGAPGGTSTAVAGIVELEQSTVADSSHVSATHCLRERSDSDAGCMDVSERVATDLPEDEVVPFVAPNEPRHFVPTTGFIRTEVRAPNDKNGRVNAARVGSAAATDSKADVWRSLLRFAAGGGDNGPQTPSVRDVGDDDEFEAAEPNDWDNTANGLSPSKVVDPSCTSPFRPSGVNPDLQSTTGNDRRSGRSAASGNSQQKTLPPDGVVSEDALAAALAPVFVSSPTLVTCEDRHGGAGILRHVCSVVRPVNPAASSAATTSPLEALRIVDAENRSEAAARLDPDAAAVAAWVESLRPGLGNAQGGRLVSTSSTTAGVSPPNDVTTANCRDPFVSVASVGHSQSPTGSPERPRIAGHSLPPPPPVDLTTKRRYQDRQCDAAVDHCEDVAFDTFPVAVARADAADAVDSATAAQPQPDEFLGIDRSGTKNVVRRGGGGERTSAVALQLSSLLREHTNQRANAGSGGVASLVAEGPKLEGQAMARFISGLEALVAQRRRDGTARSLVALARAAEPVFERRASPGRQRTEELPPQNRPRSSEGVRWADLGGTDQAATAATTTSGNEPTGSHDLARSAANGLTDLRPPVPHHQPRTMAAPQPSPFEPTKPQAALSQQPSVTTRPPLSSNRTVTLASTVPSHHGAPHPLPPVVVSAAPRADRESANIRYIPAPVLTPAPNDRRPLQPAAAGVGNGGLVINAGLRSWETHAAAAQMKSGASPTRFVSPIAVGVCPAPAPLWAPLAGKVAEGTSATIRGVGVGANSRRRGPLMAPSQDD